MKKILFLLIAALLPFSATVFAQTSDKNASTHNEGGKDVTTAVQQHHKDAAQLRKEWKSLTPEERRARKEEFQKRRVQLKDKYYIVAPEKRSARKVKRNKLTPEERAAMEEKLDRFQPDEPMPEQLIIKKRPGTRPPGNLTPEERAAIKKKGQGQSAQPTKPNRKRRSKR